MAITRPVTRTIISTTDFGIPVADQVNLNTSDIAALKPTAWVNVTFLNGYSNYPGYVTQYRKVGDVVQVRGGAAGSGSVGVAIFVLPVGFRPLATQQFAIPSYSIVGVVSIDTSGQFFANLPTDVRFVGANCSFSVS